MDTLPLIFLDFYESDIWRICKCILLLHILSNTLYYVIYKHDEYVYSHEFSAYGIKNTFYLTICIALVMICFTLLCFLIYLCISYIYTYSAIIATICMIIILYNSFNLIFHVLIEILAKYYNIYDYYSIPPCCQLVYIITCYIPIYSIIPFMISCGANPYVCINIACIKSNLKLFHFIHNNYYPTAVINLSVIDKICQYGTSKFINDVLPIITRSNIVEFIISLYKMRRYTDISNILLQTRISHHMLIHIYDIHRFNHNTYKNVKNLIDHGLPHDMLTKSLTADFLNDSYEIDNEYARWWKNTHCQRCSNIARVINKLPITDYDENISRIITSYLPYEHITRQSNQSNHLNQSKQAARRRAKRHLFGRRR